VLMEVMDPRTVLSVAADLRRLRSPRRTAFPVDGRWIIFSSIRTGLSRSNARATRACAVRLSGGDDESI
jgi:hypothetical protein